MTTVAGATEESIYTLARRTITVKETIQDNGVVVSTYEHMDAFTQAARRQYPNLSDYEPHSFSWITWAWIVKGFRKRRH